MPTSSRDNRGFTLTEVVIAILIMMVGMLGLLQAVNVATEHNMKNQLRDEAVQVGEKYTNIQRGKVHSTKSLFEVLSSSYGVRYEPSKLRGSSKPYSVEMSTSQLSDSTLEQSAQINVKVSWAYKGVTYENRVTTPVARLR